MLSSKNTLAILRDKVVVKLAEAAVIVCSGASGSLLKNIPLLPILGEPSSPDAARLMPREDRVLLQDKLSCSRWTRIRAAVQML